MKQENENILAIFHKQLGDTLLLQPALRKLSLAGHRPVRLLCPSSFHPLLQLMPGSCCPAYSRPDKSDWLIAYDSGSYTAGRALMSRAKRKTLLRFKDTGDKWYHPYVYNDILDREGGFLYRARFYWETTPVETTESFRPPALAAPPDSWMPPEIKAPYLLIHPGSAWQRKCWTVKGWNFVLAALFEETRLPILVTGGNTPWEVEHVRDICSSSSVPLVNYSRRSSLKGFMALCSRAALVLTVDGFASHLASAFNKPVLSLFGPTDPSHWHYPTARSRCGSVREFGIPKPYPMEQLSPDVVREEALRLLTETL